MVIVLTDPALGAGLRLAVDFGLSGILGACRVTTKHDVVPVEATFAYEQPESTLEHHRFFRCPLRFNQPESTLVLNAHHLDLPIPHADETLAEYVSAHADNLIRSWSTGESFMDRVRSALWYELSEGPPTLRRIASMLHMSPRTLQRRLAQEGTSLRSEVDRVRKSIAMTTLSDRTIAVSEVAFILRYDEASTFFRAFRRWTGTTPQKYRIAHA